jgi:hypothetical protein
MKVLIALALAGGLGISMIQGGSADEKACGSCPSSKVVAQQDGSKGQCAKTQANAEKEFMAEAQRMMLASEGVKACCKSTAEKPMAKGDKGCCNAKNETAKFKVFVAGEGYKFFGCKGSAEKGRQELTATGKRVGAVQKVLSKKTI